LVWVRKLVPCDEEYKFRTFENKTLGIIFEPRSEKANG
jgi:hypothetical protein